MISRLAIISYMDGVYAHKPEQGTKTMTTIAVKDAEGFMVTRAVELIADIQANPRAALEKIEKATDREFSPSIKVTRLGVTVLVEKGLPDIIDSELFAADYDCHYCEVSEFLMKQLKAACKTWEYFSGNMDYPIAQIESYDTPATLYVSNTGSFDKAWGADNEYVTRRWNLLMHFKQHLEGLDK